MAMVRVGVPMRLVSLLLLSAALLSAQVLDPPAAHWPTVDWYESTPEAQGVDGAMLEQAGTYLGEKMPSCYSLLVIRHGALIFERYYDGHTRYQAYNIKSISKSILSALTGIALSEGRFWSLEDRVADAFPEYFNSRTDPRKHGIRLKHLLTMTSGLEWQDEASCFAPWAMSNDPHRYLLELPMTAAPGEEFNYNTALTHLLSAWITRATRMTTFDYAATRLFQPLGITCPRWQVLKGTYFGGAEVYLTPRSLAKFGYLYLRGGFWDGRQIVPREWVRESTSAKVSDFYGYLWWIDHVLGHDRFTAAGHGGQQIFVVPDLDLIVVNTANSGGAMWGEPPTPGPIMDGAEPRNAMERFIVPAIRPDPLDLRPVTRPDPRRLR